MSEIPSGPPPSPSRTRLSFLERLRGAFLLQANAYEDVEHDPDAMSQAAGVVALVAVAQGIGFGAGGASALIGGIFAAFLGWLVSTAIVWAIGVKVMSHTSDFPELLRTLAFAQTPKLLLVLGILPLGPLVGIVWLVVTVLSVLAFVVAVRQALDVETARAVFVCVLAVAVSIMIGLFLGGLSTL